MREIIIRVITVVLIYTSVACLSLLSSLKVPQKNHIIKMQPLYLVIGIVGSVIFGGVSILLTVFHHDTTSLVILAFLILSGSLIIAYFQCRMFYTNKQIIIRQFWGNKKCICFDDITQIHSGLDLVLKTGSCTLTIPFYYIGIIDFLLFLGETNPKLTETTQKIVNNPPVRPFREAVWRAGECIFMYILGYALGIFGCWLIWYVDDMQFTKHIWFPVCFLLFWTISTVLSVVSAKRAHSSSFWRGIAKVCFQKGYLNL